MRSKAVLSLTIFSLAVLFGCGGTSPNTNTANTANVNTNSPVEPIRKTPEPTTNNAPTMAPFLKAYCEAWAKKDEAALRKVYSQDTLKSFEADMKAEKIKSLLKFLEDDSITGTPCEATNEKITGDRAVVKLKADRYPNGMDMVFVKENGEWKLTNQSPAVDAVIKPGANANTAK